MGHPSQKSAALAPEHRQDTQWTLEKCLPCERFQEQVSGWRRVMPSTSLTLTWVRPTGHKILLFRHRESL